MHGYVDVLKRYFEFDGRARRSEFWVFSLCSTAIFGGLAVVDYLTGTWSPDVGMGLTSGLYTFAVLFPTIAVGVRRLHDSDRSGWWMLITFVPMIGGIILLVFWCLDGTPGSNEYGPDPKGA